MNDTDKTLRDEFAMAALSALLTVKVGEVGASNMHSGHAWQVAVNAYSLADAMMKAREAKL